MKFLQTIAFLFLIFPVLSQGDEQKMLESWTRAEDGLSIEASLVSYDLPNDTLVIEKEDGSVVNILVSILILENKARLEALEEVAVANRAASKEARFESFIPDEEAGHKIHLYKPAGYIDASPSSRKTPIAFLYSPGGKSISILNRLKDVSDELGWVLVGVDAYRNTSSLEEKYAERMKNTRAAYEWVRANVSFDPSKVVFGGMSGGAWWSYQSAAEITDEAAGILAFGGWMGNMHEKDYSERMAVAIINGDEDKNAIAFESIDVAFLEKKASAEVKKFPFQGGHVLAPVETASEAARWIHEEKGFEVR